MNPDKIRTEHLNRRAYVYLRQSTMAQVVAHTESTARQYALSQRAIELGWAKEQVLIIDEDLGRSGQSVDGRSGFQRLAEDVAKGRVGAIFAIEVSRLARSSADWHRLLELCTVADVVIADEHAVYCPHDDYNDRLLLGFKGQMSEAESYWMRLRLYGAKLSKARRGELRFKLAPGVVWSDGDGGIVITPDESIRKVIELIFERFRIDGSINSVARYMREHGICVPRFDRHRTLTWRLPDGQYIQGVLKEPAFAGAYAYGRRPSAARIVDGQIRRKQNSMLPVESWPILLRDAHQGYISWDEFMANLKTLQNNRSNRTLPERRGAAKNGEGLLQGLVLCGCCGRRMRTRYLGRTNVTYYYCDQGNLKAVDRICWTVAAKTIDDAVQELFLGIVRPSELDLSLAVTREVEAQAGGIDKQWQMRIERVQYEVRIAERRYRAADPEYRLVARTLEREWDEKLRELTDIERQYDETKRRERLTLTERDRSAILALAKDLPRVWAASTTTNSDRKTMLRMLIREIVLRPVEVPRRMTSVQVIWQTGATTKLQIERPGRGAHIRTPVEAMQVIRDLSAAGQSAVQIAKHLTSRGLRSGTGQAFTAQRVRAIQHTHKLLGKPSQLPERRDDGAYSARGAACLFGVSSRIIYYWATIGRLTGERHGKRGAWWFHLDAKDIERLRHQQTG